MNNFFSRSLLLAVTVLLSSCQKEESIPQTDYSIESDDYFQVESTYPNGWIKEARYTDYSLEEDTPYSEFEYYENGFIKTAKVYSSYPQHHLYMEVSRSDDNKPLWSKYYTPEGELWFKTDYKNGLPSEKIVYSEKGTSVYSYEAGNLVMVEFNSADDSSSSITVFDKNAETRTVTVKKDGETILEETYPYTEGLGSTMLTDNQVPLINPFSNIEGNYRKLNEAFFHSPIWENSTDPIKEIHPFRYFYDYFHINFDRTTFASKLAVNSDLYQSIIEQYPVKESEVLVMNYKYKEGSNGFLPRSEERKSLSEEMAQDPELFELKYGDEYVEKVYFGKIIYMIGVLRNMPTGANAEKEIQNLARKKMENIIDGKKPLTAEEHEILNKVWFEVKFFSTLKAHRNGIVLKTHNEYKEVLQEFEEAESSVLQLEYATFEHL
ncbi:hypothetical protein [Christiangramia sp. SM2212]|uniref:Uncharacterized protein n=1 Tax=Christiangramia sediminicola TaxID=3073267 RepID=A0ABU1EL37_9FLAO|nr:hypothetical protein [Christiangramia sp. SM2212]MDR5589098.1 hypothetical protein [Christiangramia sp. SM2212]